MTPHILFAVAVVLIFLSAILISVSKTRKTAEEKQHTASALGFRPLEKAPPQLVQGIRRLHPQIPPQQLSIDNVFHQRDFDGDFYLFDLDDTSEDENTWQNTDVIGIISHKLALPRFYLIALPPVNQEQWVGKLLDRILDKVFEWAAVHQGLSRVTFADRYGFDEQYALFVENEITARGFFTEYRLSSLTAYNTPFQVVAAGHCMTVSHSYPISTKANISELKTLYRRTRDLFHLFREKKI
ncbi:MAG: hypothetical protein R6U57_02785 [Anaerolineales bacterium]